VAAGVGPRRAVHRSLFESDEEMVAFMALIRRDREHAVDRD
jgi:hypothetical protein